MTESTEIALWAPQEPETATQSPSLTPAQLQLRQMVLDSVTSPHSRRNYAKALDLLFAFAASRPLTRALLLEFRTSMEDLAPSTVCSFEDYVGCVSELFGANAERFVAD